MAGKIWSTGRPHSFRFTSDGTKQDYGGKNPGDICHNKMMVVPFPTGMTCTCQKNEAWRLVRFLQEEDVYEKQKMDHAAFFNGSGLVSNQECGRNRKTVQRR